MLVKKIRGDWRPSENRSLQVGDTIEITDATELIKAGLVVSVDPVTGEEKGAFEMYGIVTDKDIQDLKELRAKEKEEEREAKVKAELEEERRINEALVQKLAEQELAEKEKITTDTPEETEKPKGETKPNKKK